ncbi:hypothetical protein C0Q70_02099 [Pomacea canaliculata]|uniref:SEC7 domain-containing protein n=1 Tax=Pomacea canaliculata TaxID=400727 RepID=A0A2T7Q1C3_POMCA|nr:hypothetical protein C0Q70_02099 [Pomacea canaliculata]
MASKTSPSPSRIPVPVRSPASSSPIPPCYPVREVGSDTSVIPAKRTDNRVRSNSENGIVADTGKSGLVSPQSAKGKGFETFLMTGDMIIRTTPPHQKSRGMEEASSPKSKRIVYDDVEKENMFSLETSSKVSTPSHNESQLIPMPKAPVASFEELSDMSHSSSSGEFVETIRPHGLALTPDSTSLLADTSRLDEAMETLGKLESSLLGSECHSADSTLHEAPSSGDSGVHQDSNSSDSDTAEKKLPCSEDMDGMIRLMTTSMSDEKIVTSASKSEATRPLVRTSKSHENYLQSEAGMALVAIDIDDQNFAYSLDTLTYQDTNSDSSNEKVSELPQQSRSLQNSPEKKSDHVIGEREFIPGFISLEDSKPQKGRTKQDDESGRRYDENGYGQSGDTSPTSDSNGYGDNGLYADGDVDIMQLSMRSDDSDAESLYHQPTKGVDQPSAARLAKRLFNLEGFRKSDVSRHLCKKNDFSNLVAEEYLKYFDFRGDSLDISLRKFLNKFCLTGETQERERVLAHFSRHFMECNPGAFNSEDACHTLTCAIMLLNTDLHGQNLGRKMTCADFIENLSELNDGDNFPKEVLKSIYQSIKTDPIEWAVEESLPEGEPQVDELGTGPLPVSMPSHALNANPFLDLPDPGKTVEYREGYVMRKCCMEPDRRKTPLGKRGWKMVYAVLRDLILYQYKDEHQVRKGQFVESAHNVVRIHHALATKATDYTKKQHVFRLQTADWAEFLFQTGSSRELQEWIDTINLVAATLSAPPLPAGVGSQARFQRPLMPSSCTKLSIHEQLKCHEQRVAQMEQEMQLHRAAAPEKGSKSSAISNYIEKEHYLEFELKRFKTYIYLLQAKIMAPPELEPSLVETAIGEDEEISLHGSPVASAPRPYYGPMSSMAMGTSASIGKGAFSKPVQRSLSDRYSYRAAIYNTERVEYDMI